MLPALEGDCLWIEYGSRAKPRRILIDGGPIGAEPMLRAEIEKLPLDQRRFELAVITHVDSDHIAGILKLLADPPKGLHMQQVWFNAYKHLAPGMLGPLEGEFLTVHLKEMEKRRKGSWNGSFKGAAVGVPASGVPPVFNLAGQMKLTVLAPGVAALAKLRIGWKKVLQEYNLLPGSGLTAKDLLKKSARYRPGFLGDEVRKLALEPFLQDKGIPNRSSIALLASYRGRVCLLAADAWPGDIEDSLKKIAGPSRRIFPVDLIKVPHHGSAKNNSSDFYKRVSTSRYLISSSGARHGHPDAPAIARILVNKKGPADLFFNYDSDFNRRWADKDLQHEYRYTAHYPEPGETGICVDLDA